MNSVLSQSGLDWGKRGTAGATIAGQLTFERVSFSVPGRDILQEVSFSLAPGEIASILGPSGCGKTTLLRLAAGVSIPSKGRILLDEQEISGPAKWVPPEKRSIGLMFQDFVLFPHLNVLENVKYGLRNWGRAEAESAALHALERVGMRRAAGQFPHQLSGGEQQRVALARAAVPRPQILLMDEPFSGLDQQLRASVRAETVALLREMRATAMLVTHDPEEAMDVSDRIFLMRNGRIVQSGPPQELYASPVDPDAGRFLVTCNEFAGPVKAGMLNTPLGAIPAAGFADDAEVLVQVRPESLVLDRRGKEAFVRDRKFRGHHVVLTLIFSGSEQEILAEVPAELAPEKGKTGKFMIADPSKKRGVLVFKKPPGVTIVK